MAGILQSAAERAALAAWLAAQAGFPAVGPDRVHIAAPASGWSNETVIAAIDGVRVVVRLAPSRLSMFPDYDLTKEWLVIEALHDRGRPPVPRPVAQDLAGRLFGRAFFVMAFVEGETPSDSKPTYAEKGWLAEGPVAGRRLFWKELLQALAAVHETDWRSGPLARLAPPDGVSSLSAAIGWLERLDRWSGAPQPVVAQALARLRATMPVAGAGDVLLWGDARPANVLAREFRIAALLDWELAAVGPPELDLAWLQEMHWLRVAGAGVAQPEGFPDDAGLQAGYEAASGRRLGDLGWYRLLSAVKVAVLMYRHFVVAVDRGAMPAGHRLLRDNIATRRLATLLA